MRKAFNPFESKRKAFNPFDENFQDKIQIKVNNNTDWNDKTTVLKLVAKNGLNLENANSALKSDREVVLVAVTQNCYALNYADKKFKADKSFISEALDHCNGWILSYVDNKIKADKKIVLKAIEKDPSSIYYADDKIKKDRVIALKVVQLDGLCLKYLHHFKDDKEIVKIAVENDLTDFAYKASSERLRNDDEIKNLRGKKIDKVLSFHRKIKLRDEVKTEEVKTEEIKGEEVKGEEVKGEEVKVRVRSKKKAS